MHWPSAHGIRAAEIASERGKDCGGLCAETPESKRARLGVVSRTADVTKHAGDVQEKARPRRIPCGAPGMDALGRIATMTP